MPAGTAGEIYIGGCAVARGYLGRPALTAELFLPDGGGVPGSVMYRTGDLGRWRDDGNLEVTGRADRQLKVRGFRVEPGEIESVLAGHPDVGQVAVVATGAGPGGTRLAAYYTLARGPSADHDPHRPPSAAGLRRFLRGRLPGYMIPAAFVAVDHMPLTPEGQPDPGFPGRPPASPPGQDQGKRHTPVQAGMSYLWSDLLNKEQVGLDDDFFALGGDSLLRGFARPRRTPARAGSPLRARRPGWTSGGRRNSAFPLSCTRPRRPRHRTGGGLSRYSSPDRPASSGLTCCANCWPPPPRGSGAG